MEKKIISSLKLFSVHPSERINIGIIISEVMKYLTPEVYMIFFIPCTSLLIQFDFSINFWDEKK